MLISIYLSIYYIGQKILSDFSIISNTVLTDYFDRNCIKIPISND